MNIQTLHSAIKIENQILKLQHELIKIEDEKEKNAYAPSLMMSLDQSADKLKMEIIRLNGKVYETRVRLR